VCNKFIKAKGGPFWFCSILFGLGAFFFVLISISRPEKLLEGLKCASAFGVMSLGFYIYFKGFYLKLTNNSLIYRDGCYRKHELYFNEIEDIDWGSAHFENIGNAVSVPRLIVFPKDKCQAELVINIRVFGFKDAVGFYNEVKRAIGKEVSVSRSKR